MEQHFLCFKFACLWMMCISCRQHIVVFCILIQSSSVWLLFRELRPFTLRGITERCSLNSVIAFCVYFWFVHFFAFVHLPFCLNVFFHLCLLVMLISLFLSRFLFPCVTHKKISSQSRAVTFRVHGAKLLLGDCKRVLHMGLSAFGG